MTLGADRSPLLGAPTVSEPGDTTAVHVVGAVPSDSRSGGAGAIDISSDGAEAAFAAPRLTRARSGPGTQPPPAALPRRGHHSAAAPAPAPTAAAARPRGMPRIALPPPPSRGSNAAAAPVAAKQEKVPAEEEAAGCGSSSDDEEAAAAPQTAKMVGRLQSKLPVCSETLHQRRLEQRRHMVRPDLPLAPCLAFPARCRESAVCGRCARCLMLVCVLLLSLQHALYRFMLRRRGFRGSSTVAGKYCVRCQVCSAVGARPRGGTRVCHLRRRKSPLFSMLCGLITNHQI